MAKATAGRLDRQITLEFRTKGKSGTGAPTEAWGGAAAVWAMVEPLSGREYYASLAQQTVAQEMLVFTIHFRADVRPGSTRIKYNAGDVERIYNVRRVAGLGRDQWLEVHADSATA